MEAELASRTSERDAISGVIMTVQSTLEFSEIVTRAFVQSTILAPYFIYTVLLYTKYSERSYVQEARSMIST